MKTKETKIIGLVFRKFDRDYARDMRKQTFDFIREIDKKASITEIVRYNVQLDPNAVKRFHSHIIFKQPCMSTIRNVSERVLKADKWDDEYIYHMPFFGDIKVLRSCYGEVRIHAVTDEKGFLNYMDGDSKKGSDNLHYYVPLKQFQQYLKFQE